MTSETRPWLVTGAGGMLGQELTARLAARGQPVAGLDRAALDITDAAAVRRAIRDNSPALVINCAAWTAVDDAEAREEEALLVNGVGAGHVATSCARAGVPMVHISTDYVFGGDRVTPYAEDDAPAPRTAYGRTKAAGERAVLATLPEAGYVVRTGWLYGAGGGNFVRAIMRREQVAPTLEVVDDQRGQPTWTRDLAALLIRFGHAITGGAAGADAIADPAGAAGVAGPPPGVYHGTSSGDASRWELAREIVRLLGSDPERVRPISSASLAEAAPRPAYTVLGHDRWRAVGIEPIRDWRAALAEAAPALREADQR